METFNDSKFLKIWILFLKTLYFFSSVGWCHECYNNNVSESFKLALDVAKKQKLSMTYVAKFRLPPKASSWNAYNYFFLTTD